MAVSRAAGLERAATAAGVAKVTGAARVADGASDVARLAKLLGSAEKRGIQVPRLTGLSSSTLPEVRAFGASDLGESLAAIGRRTDARAAFGEARKATNAVRRAARVEVRYHVIEKLLASGFFDDARLAANEHELLGYRAVAQIRVAEAMGEARLRLQAKSLLREARHSVANMTSTWELPSDHVRQELVVSLLREGLVDEAGREAALIAKNPDKFDLDRADSMARVAEAMATAGRYDAAIEVAETIGIPQFRDASRQVVAVAMAQKGRHQKALQIASQFKSPAIRADVQRRVAVALVEAGYRDPAHKAFRAARRTITRANANAFSADFSRSEARGELAYAMAEAGFFDDAESVARTLDQGSDSEHIFEMVASGRAKLGAK